MIFFSRFKLTAIDNYGNETIDVLDNYFQIGIVDSYESNYSRARAMSRSFIYYNDNWAERIRLFDKMMSITKEEIIDFVKNQRDITDEQSISIIKNNALEIIKRCLGVDFRI